jgi:hypothetical protein
MLTATSDYRKSENAASVLRRSRHDLRGVVNERRESIEVGTIGSEGLMFGNAKLSSCANPLIYFIACTTASYTLKQHWPIINLDKCTKIGYNPPTLESSSVL